jgi:dolichol-phosphate mannosyltransferase
VSGISAVHHWHGTASVVVPTYNERDNVAILIARLAAVLPADRAEIIIVDDSSDDTGAAVLAAAATVEIPVRLLHREPHERIGGLGGAVLHGLQAATGEWAVVMDGDLQHPPETVPLLLAAKELGRADAVVASRYVNGGSASGLSGGWRRWGSSGAGALARSLFPRALRGCTDPMTGFFAVRRAALHGVELRPDGFKILLEILARAGTLRVREVPFRFAERHAGDSKAGLGQALVYLRHLARLRTAGTPGRLAGFLVVGASGLIPNLGAMILLQRAGVHYLEATVIATLLAITWNFVLSDHLIFRGRRSGKAHQRYVGYLGLNLLDVVLRLPMMAVLVGGLRVPVITATLACTAVISAARFAALNRFLYRHVPVTVPRPAAGPSIVLNIREAA